MMKNYYKKMGLAGLVAMVGISASAAPIVYRDVDTYSSTVNTATPLSGTFNLRPGDGSGTTSINIANYDGLGGEVSDVSGLPAHGTIYFAQYFIYIRNSPNFTGDSFDFYVNDNLIRSVAFTGDGQSTGNNGNFWGFQGYVFQGLLDPFLQAALLSDGSLNYKVTSTSGSFTVDHVRLDVAAVPDGASTVALLGLSALGLGAFRRKIQGLIS